MGLFGISSYFAMIWKNKLVKRYSMPDDPMDAWAIHGVGGIMGSILTGFFADSSISGDPEITGAFYGKPMQVPIQMMGVSAVALWSFVMSFLLLEAVQMLFQRLGWPITASEAEEQDGLDSTDHGVVPESPASLRSVTLGHVTTVAAAEGSSAVMEAYDFGPEPEPETTAVPSSAGLELKVPPEPENMV
jgi:ammonia channel protein AmtB